MCLWASFLSIAACLVNRKSQGLAETIFVGRPYTQGRPQRTRNGLFPNPTGTSVSPSKRRRNISTFTPTNPIYGSFVKGNGLRLPFKDRSFDCVICNSVIEHVGGCKAQQALTEEIRRVSRHLYIVQVPAEHFPLELHFLLPFVQYLPQRFRRSICLPGYHLVIGSAG